MKSGIEVERRVILSPEQRQDMLTRMQGFGAVKEVRRVMIDFSGEERARTVMIRINDGQQEFVAKSGGLSDIVRREAIPTLAPSVALETSLSFMFLLGYTEAHVSLRHMYIAEHDALEYSVRDAFMQGTTGIAATLFEIEALNVEEGEQEAASTKIETALSACGLTALTPTEWEQWVKETYEHIDETFTYSETAASALTQSLIASDLLSA